MFIFIVFAAILCLIGGIACFITFLNFMNTISDLNYALKSLGLYDLFESLSFIAFFLAAFFFTLCIALIVIAIYMHKTEKTLAENKQHNNIAFQHVKADVDNLRNETGRSTANIKTDIYQLVKDDVTNLKNENVKLSAELNALKILIEHKAKK